MKQSKKIRARRRCFLVLSLFWMAVIYWFSAQNGEQSGAFSVTAACFFGLPEGLVRKAAHLMEYAVLGGFLTGYFETFSMDGKKKTAAAWLVSVLYAASDELHQMCTAGRNPAVWDVCIDGIGAVIGVLLVGTILRKRKKMT